VTGDYGDEENHYKPLLQFWNDKGELLKSADLSKGEYRNLKWTSNGSRLVTASDALRIWDRKGNLISMGNSEDYLWGISSNKEGSRVVTSSKKQRIVLWNNKAEVIVTREF
jgi:WD40 repeat protein